MIIKLNMVRLAFPALFEPSSFTAADGTQSKPRYGARFLMAPNHPDVAKVSAAIQQVAKEAWADRAPAMLKALKLEGKLCMRNGDTKPNWDGFPGNVFVSASNKNRPLVLAADGRTPLQEKDGIIYAGCWVNASIDIYAQKKGGERINASFRGVQFVKDGDAFGGGAPARAEEFEDLSGGASTEDFGATVEEEDAALI